MTCIDGYAMAQKGAAARRSPSLPSDRSLPAPSSVVALMLLAPPLADFALRFGPPENFALLVLGLLVLALHERRVDGAVPDDGRVRISARHDRHRHHDRLLPLLTTAWSRWATASASCRWRWGCSASREIMLSARRRRRRRSTSRACASSCPRERSGAVAAPDRARNGARLSDRHHSRAGTRDLLVRLLFGGAAAVEAAGGVRQRAVDGVAGPESANNSATTGAFVPMLALGLPSGADSRHHARGDDDPRRRARDRC